MRDNLIDFQIYRRERCGVFMCKILNELHGKSVSELFEMYNITPEPPIDLNKILKEIGISAIATDFSEIEKDADLKTGEILGATVSKKDKLSIFYREDDSENRQRFTIAHELAHCCLHSLDLQESHVELRRNNEIKDVKERQADVFAGELLIPEVSIKKIYDKLFSPSLNVLAQIYKVSTNVMAARLDYLGLPYLKDIQYRNS